jgi:hypothetical protein
MALEKVGADVRIKGARKAARDSKDVARGIGSIGDEASRSSRRIGSMNRSTATLARTAKVGGVALASLGAVMVGGSAMMLRNGVALNAQFQDLTASFTTLLGSEDKAQSFIETMRGVTADSPLRLTEALDAARGLVGSGMDPSGVRKTTEAMQNMALVAGGDVAEKFGRVANIMAVIQARGKIGAEDLNRFSDAGVAVRKVLEKELGLTGEEVANIGKLSISSEKAIGALNRAFTSGDMAGAVENASATYSVQMASLKKDFEQIQRLLAAPAFRVINEQVVPQIRRQMKGIIPVVDKASRRVDGIWRSNKLSMEDKLRFSGRAIVQEVGPAIRPLIDAVEGELGKIDVGKAVTGAIETGAPAMADALAKQVPHMASAFVTAFRNAGPGGQLLTVALLAAKFGAFKTVGTMVGGRFAGSFRTGAVTGIQADAAGGKYNKAGRAMGSVLGAAAILAMVPAIRDALVDAFPDLARYSGSKGWGNLRDDIMGSPQPGSRAAGTSRDARPASPGERRDRGVPPGAQRDSTPRADTQRPLGPSGPAALPSRGAQFSLPGVTSETVTEIAPVILDGAKVGELRIKRETRKLARK